MSRITTLLLAIFLTSCASGGGDDQASLKIALVTAVSGNPYVLRENRLIQLTVRSALDLEDTVITGPQDQIRFRFQDGTQVTAGHNSQLRIESFDSKQGLLHLSSSDGAYRMDLGKVMKQKRASFRLSTPFGEVESGDRARLWLKHAPGSHELEVLLLQEGEIRVSNEFGETFLRKPGEACTVAFSSAPSTVKVLDDSRSRTLLAFGD